jgi:3-oxoacyl-[acyl-carrier protein] reductase
VSLSRALAGSGVTSNTALPGLIWTPLAAPWFKQLAREQDSEDPRAGRPEDVAAAVCFLASLLADYITGTTLRVDGGATATV